MRLYLTAAGRYVGTQDEARKDGKGWALAEVPTDKAGLIDYLNDQLPVADEPSFDNVVPLPPPILREADPKLVDAGKRIRTADAIEDFILNEATVAQVENIFSTIGARFAELVKKGH